VSGVQARAGEFAGRFFTSLPTAVEAISAGDDRLALGYAGPGQHEADGKPLLYDMQPGSIDLALVKAGRCPFLAEHIRTLGTVLGAVVAAVPEGDGLPVWLHGDLQPGNLLVRDGRLSGVLDFGGLGAGDGAADLAPAWSVLRPDARDAFRAALRVDDVTWARGRAWAFSIALVALPYYVESNPALAAVSRRTIEAVLAEEPAALL